MLAAAVSGQLTEQRASDGNAATLLKKIFAEKAAALAAKNVAKKSSRENAELAPAPVPDDDPIPANWTWCRLGDVTTLCDGDYIFDKKLPNLDAKFLRGKSKGTILTGGKFISAGTTLILVDGENSGEIFRGKKTGSAIPHLNRALFQSFPVFVAAVSVATALRGARRAF